ncbi:MAG TPA: ribonuclease H-like domain-containing protein [Treponemataceae bacterium]|nr:ribonuclease H-like domain-containing protein [Treponemataceae bacterium]
MARSSLSGRLARIRGNERSGARDNARERAPNDVEFDRADRETGPLPALGAGWEAVAPYVYERESRFELSDFPARFSDHLPLLFPRERAAMRDRFYRSGAEGRVEPIAFFDLETTGLSHGAGTIAFMAGIARVEGRSLSVRQYLLADYPGEAAFLERLAASLADAAALVSFNGKCFDAQILSSRFLMNGLKLPVLASAVHLDLLFPSRRLWRDALGSCRLSVIEEALLGVRRELDLPGSEAPDAWFDFVRRGETDRLILIGEHNRDDCVSLVLLLELLNREIEAGTGRAALIRALDLRASGAWAEAARFLAPLAAGGDRLALRLLAIDAEHRLRDLALALEYARALEDDRRVERVSRKLGLT